MFYTAKRQSSILSYLLYHILFEEKWDVTAQTGSHSDTIQGTEPQKSTKTKMLCVNLNEESSHKVLILAPYHPITETISNLQSPQKHLQRRSLSQNSLLGWLFQLHNKI